MALKLKGSTSGFVGLDAPSVAGNNTLILPENSGSAFQVFANDITAGVTTFTTVTVNRNGDLTVPGTISIGGTLTYEDVTSVDSIGIVTARGLSIFGNTTGLQVASGISTFQAITGTTGTFSGQMQSASAVVTGGITATGGNIVMNDSSGSSANRIKLGTSQDLSLFHNGTHSFINNSQGTLVLQSDVVSITNEAGNSNRFNSNAAGNVSLYFSDSVKLKTTGSGIDITNDLNVAGISTHTGLAQFANTINLTHASAGQNYIYFNEDLQFAKNGTGTRLKIKSGGTVAIPSQGASNANPRLLFESSVDSNDFSFSQYEDSNGVYTLIGQNVQLSSNGNTNALDSGHRSSGIFFDGRNHGYLTFLTADAGNSPEERLRIDSAGRLKINGATSGAKISMNVADSSGLGSGSDGLRINSGTPNCQFVRLGTSYSYGGATGSGGASFLYSYDALRIMADTNNEMTFHTSGAIRMQIAGSTGNVGINDSTNGYAEKLQVTGDYNNQYAIAAKITQSSGSLMRFATTDGLCGSITGNGTNSAYNTSSDYRLKENDVSITDGISRVKQLRPIKFNWKTDPSTTQDGFFAHEVSPVVPESVTGEKDASIDEIGAGYQMIDHSKLVPLLTAALQEAIAKVETLEAEVAALKGS